MLRHKVILLAMLGCVAVPAVAQSPHPKGRYESPITDEYYHEGRLFGGNAAAATDSYGRALRFAACAAKIDGRSAREVLAAAAGSVQESRALARLAERNRSCTVDREAMPPIMLRGAIAESLWKRGGSVVNPTNRTQIDLSEIEAFVRAAPLGEMRTKVGTMPLSWASRCQVLTLPKESAALIATKPGSSEEAALAATIYGKSEVCGVPSTLGETPPVLARAAIADALYQHIALASQIAAK